MEVRVQATMRQSLHTKPAGRSLRPCPQGTIGSHDGNAPAGKGLCWKDITRQYLHRFAL